MDFKLCTSSDHALYLYKVSQKYHKEFKSYGADTISMSKFTKGHNPLTCDKGMVLNLYISWDDAVYVY